MPGLNALPGGSGLVVNGVVMGWADLTVYGGVGGVDIPFFADAFGWLKSISWSDGRTMSPVYGKGSIARASERGRYFCTGRMEFYLEGWYFLQQAITLLQGSLAIANVAIAEKAQAYGMSDAMRNTIPVGVVREDFPLFNLSLSYSRQRPEAFMGAEAPLSLLGITTDGMTTLLPGVKLLGVDSNAASGDTSTTRRVDFQVYGRVTETVLPFLG